MARRVSISAEDSPGQQDRLEKLGSLTATQIGRRRATSLFDLKVPSNVQLQHMRGPAPPRPELDVSSFRGKLDICNATLQSLGGTRDGSLHSEIQCFATGQDPAELPPLPSPRMDATESVIDLPDDAPALKALVRELRQRLAAAVGMGEQLLEELGHVREEAGECKRELHDVSALYAEATSVQFREVQRANKELVRAVRDYKSKVAELQLELQSAQQEIEEEKRYAERQEEVLQKKQAELNEDKKWVEEQAVLAYGAAEKAEGATDFSKLARVMAEFCMKHFTMLYWKKLRRWREENKKRRAALDILLVNGRTAISYASDRRAELYSRLARYAQNRARSKAATRTTFVHRAETIALHIATDCLNEYCETLFDALQRAVWSWDNCERRLAESRRDAAQAAREAAENLDQAGREFAEEKAAMEASWREEVDALKERLRREEAAAAEREQQWKAQRAAEQLLLWREHEEEVAKLCAAQDAEKAERAEWEAATRAAHAAELARSRAEAAESLRAAGLLADAKQQAAEAALARGEEAAKAEADQRCAELGAEIDRLRAARDELALELHTAKQVHLGQVRDMRAAQDARRRWELRRVAEQAELELSEQQARSAVLWSAAGGLSVGCLLQQWAEAAALWQLAAQREAAATADRQRAEAEHQLRQREAGAQRLRSDERAQKERAAAGDAAVAALAAGRERDKLAAELQALRRQVGGLGERNRLLTAGAREREQEAELARHALALVRSAAAERKLSGGDADLTGALRRALDLTQDLRLRAALTEQALRSPPRARSSSPASPSTASPGRSARGRLEDR
eukprot:TRINITY_DN9533_c0_g1_i1.p1 TRINITY_DN9533_c0_g1~~TRINITY_DN9533_c0_g1_i1.p1  ORF type:complete len:833 (+),score=362.78 TRINITY_DN9533_c0_g1_i1:77-2500(+)